MKKINKKLFIKLILPFIIIIISAAILNIFLFGYLINIHIIKRAALDIPLNQIKTLLFLFFSIVIFFQSLLIIFGYSFIIKKIIVLPVRMFINAVENISAGNTEYKINVDRDDEFGELQRRFNTMMENLKKINKQIENIREKNFKLEKMQIMSNFSSGIAHEINNPINNISLNLEVLKKKANADNSINDIAGKIDDELSKITAIISKFSEFSKVAIENKTEIYPENFINEINEILYYYKFSKDFSFEFADATGNKRIKILVEPVKFILTNLIKNAIEALPEKNGFIKVILEEKNNFYNFEIIDNGEGIEEHKIDKLFEPFYTTKENGSGLGLSISRQLADLCKYELSCKRNSDSKGMTFTLKINNTEF